MRDIYYASDPVMLFNQRPPIDFHPNRDGSLGDHIGVGLNHDGAGVSQVYVVTEDNVPPEDGIRTKYFDNGIRVVHDETVLFKQKGVEYVHPSEDVPCEKRYFGLGVIPKPQS